MYIHNGDFNGCNRDISFISIPKVKQVRIVLLSLLLLLLLLVVVVVVVVVLVTAAAAVVVVVVLYFLSSFEIQPWTSSLLRIFLVFKKHILKHCRKI
jgi:hypothetical protein